MKQNSTAAKAIDLRVIKTERAIHDAFMKLLERTEYSRITVSALAAEAQINRKTFYAHYATIDELLESVYERKIKELFAPLAESTSSIELSSAKAMVHTLLQALDDNFEQEKNLLRNVDFFKLADITTGPLERFVIEERVRRGLIVDKHVHRNLVCCVGALLAAYADWKRNGEDGETLEDVSERVCHLLSDGIADLL